MPAYYGSIDRTLTVRLSAGAMCRWTARWNGSESGAADLWVDCGRNEADGEHVAIADPAEFAAIALEARWRSEGLRWRGGSGEASG